VYLNRTKGNQRDLYALLRQRIGRELVFEDAQSLVELGNGFAFHGSRSVEKQNARAARFGIFGKLSAAKRYLI
jgi:hypothetical protein